MTEGTFEGTQGRIFFRVWDNPAATHLVVIAHGYGEHVGRYEWVADTLVAHGASVYAPDHMGHGRSDGDRVIVSSYEDVDTDLHMLVQQARGAYPGLPLVLIGHSMGGMIGARYAQRHQGDLAALVLSGPVLGSWHSATDQLDLPQIPDEPLDVSMLSRDPQIGEVYAADPLVHHGPFERPTLQALKTALATIGDGPGLGDLPTLWVHGEDDQLVPITETRAGMQAISGSHLTVRTYPGARHEVFNETNKAEVLQDVADFIDRVLP